MWPCGKEQFDVIEIKIFLRPVHQTALKVEGNNNIVISDFGLYFIVPHRIIISGTKLNGICGALNDLILPKLRQLHYICSYKNVVLVSHN